MSTLEIPTSELKEFRFKSLNEPLFIHDNSEYNEDELFEETLKENLEILNRIVIPERFNKIQIKRKLSNMISKDLEEDKIFQTEKRIQKYQKKMNQYLMEYFKEIYEHLDNILLHHQDQILNISNDFLNSDLHPSFLRIVTLSFKTKQRFFEIYKKKIKREESMLRLTFNNRTKFRRVIDEHNSWVEKLNPFLDDMSMQCIAFIWYIDLWNSKKLEDLFQEKTLRMSALEKNTFRQMLAQLESMVAEVRRRLIVIDKEEFVNASDSRDPTIALLTNSIIALSNSTP